MGYQALARSISWCWFEPGSQELHVLLARSRVFFLPKFPLSSDLIYEWVQMHLIILRGRNPRHPIRIHLFVCKKSSSAHSKRASRQLLAKDYALKTG